MKSLLIETVRDEIKKFRKGWGWYVFGAFIFLVLPNAINQYEVYQQSQMVRYYQEAPIEEFYQAGYIIPSDVCFGDTEQTWVSQREVFQTNRGWDAQLVRELQNEDDAVGKVYEEFAPSITIEPRDGEGSRTQSLPADLEVGTYYWQLSFTLFLPMGVERRDVPLFISEPFEVKDCSTVEEIAEELIEEIINEFN